MRLSTDEHQAILASALALAAALWLSGCTTMANLFQDGGGTRQGASSSLVDFLYPNGEIPPNQDAVIPALALPLRVGLAFVPGTGLFTPGLSEAHKAMLLERVRQAFADRDFIGEVTIIPDTYLRSRQGFGTLDQVARLYGLDVMALVSYDQVVHAEDTKAALLYWTIVGAYFIKGSRNDVQTFVDTAVFDLKSRKLLMRAPGVDRIEGTSTLVDSAEAVRRNRERGFERAMADMTANLAQELDRFVVKVKEDKRVAAVSYRDGYSGGGGADWVLLLIASALLAARRRR